MKTRFTLFILGAFLVSSCETTKTTTSSERRSIPTFEPDTGVGRQPQPSLQQVVPTQKRTRRQRKVKSYEDRGLRGFRTALDNQETIAGRAVAYPTLTVVGAGVEVGKTGVGAVTAGGNFLKESGRRISKAWDWWLNEAPKKSN